MPKGDFMIHSGEIAVKVGKSIPYNNENFGTTGRERTKKISKLYKENFLNFRKEIEGVDYYKRVLFSNYKFKDKEISSEVKSDFNKNKNTYHYLNEVIPMKSKILHLADDFGQVDILLVAKSLDRKMTTFIQDKIKFQVASNCYTNLHRKVKYISEIGEIDFTNFDTLLLNDSKSESIIDKEKFSFFNRIVVVNNRYSIDKIIKRGFKIIVDNAQVIVLENNKNTIQEA
jgi:hypothetical protein